MHIGIEIDLAPFVGPWGQFHYVVMPFGVKNGPAVFQRLILRGCKSSSEAYIDDVAVYSHTWEDHCQLLNMFCNA